MRFAAERLSSRAMADHTKSLEASAGAGSIVERRRSSGSSAASFDDPDHAAAAICLLERYVEQLAAVQLVRRGASADAAVAAVLQSGELGGVTTMSSVRAAVEKRLRPSASDRQAWASPDLKWH